MFGWILGIGGALVLLIIVGAYICYRIAFSVPGGGNQDPYYWHASGKPELVQGRAFEIIDHAAKLPYEPVTVTSGDGSVLWGRYYEAHPDAPIQVQFHGYRSCSLRDFSGGLALALDSGCNVLLVDQRAHGKSGGRCLSFGILERQDCLAWVDYIAKRWGTDRPIILAGISMGAGTVMMASDLDLPGNVVGIIADCGYTSARDIICKVMQDIHYPRFLYPLVRLGGLLFGGFDPDACTATDSLRKTGIPVLFIHGEGDTFVPCEMTLKNYEACASPKTLLTVPNAGHGLSYLEDTERYSSAVKAFLQKVLG